MDFYPEPTAVSVIQLNDYISYMSSNDFGLRLYEQMSDELKEDLTKPE